jgi:hypothetical protein
MIVNDATTALLTAIRAALVADATLAGIVGTDTRSGAVKVFSRPPAHIAMPFVTFGDTSQREFSTSDTYGQEIIVDVHCWAMRQADGNQSPATGTARQMMGRIETLLHMQPDTSGDRPTITVAGFNLIIAVVTGRSQLMLDPDGETNHGFVTVSARIGHS